MSKIDRFLNEYVADRPEFDRNEAEEWIIKRWGQRRRSAVMLLRYWLTRGLIMDIGGRRLAPGRRPVLGTHMSGGERRFVCMVNGVVADRFKACRILYPRVTVRYGTTSSGTEYAQLEGSQAEIRQFLSDMP